MENKLPTRKRLRIIEYDYSKEGMYFITICIKDRLELLGRIKDINYIELTQEGTIVKESIKQIEKRYINVEIDEYVIMPNHIHMILAVNNKTKVTISRMIKQYKAYVSKKVGYAIWQKSFYEHIIRNEKEYIKIKNYIQNNIRNGKEDRYF
ncbi:MAG: transposase [Clostridia bacterium]|nr:transposase [Clostridia bacterium]